MGYAISWIGVRNIDRSVVLERLGLTDTGRHDECNEAPFSAASLLTGWVVVWVNDFDYPNRVSLAQIFDDAECLIMQIEEHVMFCSATFLKNGKRTWKVEHDAQEDIRHLDLSGELPKELEPIIQGAAEQQDFEDGEAEEVDFYFDVPCNMAKSIVGFKHDETLYEGEPHAFTELRPIANPSPRGFATRVAALLRLR